MQVTILGNNSAVPAYDRHPTAQVLNIRGHLLLLDCGEGTQLQLLKYKIKHQHIDHVFISHLHGDHFFGLPGLLMNWDLNHRTRPVHIYTPEANKLRTMLTVWIDEPLSFELVFHPILADANPLILETTNFTVRAFAQSHRIPCAGFLFKETQFPPKILSGLVNTLKIPYAEIKSIRGGADFVSADGTIYTSKELLAPIVPPKSYAFCTDTLFLPENAAHIKGVDMLYHEATFDHSRLDRALATCHSTTLQAAEMAELAQTQKLLIGHFSARYEDLSLLLDEAQSLFQETALAIEGQTFDI